MTENITYPHTRVVKKDLLQKVPKLIQERQFKRNQLSHLGTPIIASNLVSTVSKNRAKTTEKTRVGEIYLYLSVRLLSERRQMACESSATKPSTEEQPK